MTLTLEIAVGIILAYFVIRTWRGILAVGLMLCILLAILLVGIHYLEKWAMNSQMAKRQAQLVGCVHRYCDGKPREWKVDHCGFPLLLMVTENADDIAMNNSVIELGAIRATSPMGRWCDAQTKPWWEFEKPWWDR